MPFPRKLKPLPVTAAASAGDTRPKKKRECQRPLPTDRASESRPLNPQVQRGREPARSGQTKPEEKTPQEPSPRPGAQQLPPVAAVCESAERSRPPQPNPDTIQEKNTRILVRSVPRLRRADRPFAASTLADGSAPSLRCRQCRPMRPKTALASRVEIPM